MENCKLKDIVKLIKKSENIVITTHLNPDGDGIGAGLGLFLGINKYLKNENSYEKNVRFIIEDDLPENLKFLFGSEMIENYKNYKSLKEIDLLISLDAAVLDRVGKVKELKKENTVLLNIDHHISNNYFGDINYVEANTASTSEIIYEILDEFGIKLDKEISEALYTGIVNDTGNFKHSNVKKSTLKKAGKLIENGADNTKIVRKFLDNKSLASLNLYKCALENLSIYEDKKLIVSIITKENLENYNGTKADTEGIVEFILQHNNSQISLFLREENNGRYKGSMRTKSDDLDLNKICSNFNGGGHKKAAGFSSDLSAEKIIAKIIEIL